MSGVNRPTPPMNSDEEGTAMSNNPPGQGQPPDKTGQRPSRLSKIKHVEPKFGHSDSPEQSPTAPAPSAPTTPTKPSKQTKPGVMEPEPVQMAESSGPVATPMQISAFGRERKHEEEWSRTPNINGTGAIHVKTFHSKITDDALVYMDQQINEWLDAHPEYEVKFVTSTVGTLTGKNKEPNIICQIWV